MKKKHLLITLIVLGIVGTVIFFPLNIGNQYTCLFHKFIDDSPTFSEFSMHGDEGNMHHSKLRFYLRGYAYFWWASIALFTLSIIIVKKMYVNKLKREL